jgi:hypothetical protein
LIWNFFVTNHGKDEVDKTTALLKREVRKEKIKTMVRKIQNVVEVVAFFRFEANK